MACSTFALSISSLSGLRFQFDLQAVGFSLVSVNLNLLGVDSDLSWLLPSCALAIAVPA